MTKATIQRQKLIADFIDSGNVSSQACLRRMGQLLRKPLCQET